MQQLSGQDATFLFMENGSAHMHVTIIYIYDQSTSPNGKVRFKDILAHVEDRLHTSRVFRQKLVSVPLNLDYPYWVEDDSFDLEFHIRHIALPAPGDWRQFCIQVARLDSRPLDRSRPLWEMTVIEGLNNIGWLPKDSYAIVTKIHHAAIDGATGMEIAAGLHDTTPEPVQSRTDDAWQADVEPTVFDLLGRAALNNIRSPFRFASVLAEAAPALGKSLLGMRADRDGRSGRAPRTRFNDAISPHRVYEGRIFEIDDVRAMKGAVPGATVNDTVLAICGGALRRYLEARNTLPDDSLIAMVPINVRTDDEYGTAGNQISVMRAGLRTDIADPLERLRAIHQETSRSKEVTNAVAARQLTDISKHMPAPTLALAARLVTGSGLAQATAHPLANCVVTNVPGPRVPLYMNGAELKCLSGCGPLVDGVGLDIVITSFSGKIMISFTACREIVPDPEMLVQNVQEAFDELRAVTLPTGIKPPNGDNPGCVDIAS